MQKTEKVVEFRQPFLLLRIFYLKIFMKNKIQLLPILFLLISINVAAQFASNFTVVADGRASETYGDLVNLDLFDLNDDGYADIVLSFTDRLVWLRNDQVENFHNDSTILRVNLPLEKGFFKPVFEDLDDDGMPDLCAGTVWRKNLGNGNFENQSNIFSSTMAEIADFDDDGLPDALTIDSTNIYFQKNLGNGSFATPEILKNTQTALVFEAIDLDDDGLVDFISKETDGCFFYKNIGNAIFQPILLFAESPKRLLIEDFNNDGKNDLISAESNGNIVWYNLNSNDELVQVQQISDGYTRGDLALGDLTDDGTKDLIVGEIGGEGYYFSYLASRERFSDSGELPIPGFYGSFGLLEIDDLNNNGKNDILAEDLGLGFTQPVWLKHSVEPGVFEKNKELFFVFGAPISIQSADLEGDGDNDIFVNSWMIENLGSGNYAKKRPFKGFGGKGFRADLNGDGLKDLALPNQSDNNIVWRPNTGNDVLGNPIPIPGLLYGCREVGGGDLDGDGDIDLFAATGVETLDEDVLFFWFENDGAGNFTEHLIDEDIQWVLSVLSIDVNGDGTIDPVMILSNAQETIWYPNRGNGQFDAPQLLFPAGTPAPTRILQRSITDLNQDGLPDLIFALRSLTGNPKVVWYKNLGNGNFSSQIVLWTYNWAGLMDCYFTAYDVDSNGLLDMVIADSHGNQLYYLKGISPGEFAPPLLIHDEDGFGDYYGLASHDYDGDGKLDLLFGREHPDDGHHELCVLLNNTPTIRSINFIEQTTICHSNLTQSDPFDDAIVFSLNIDGAGLSAKYVVKSSTEVIQPDTFFYNKRETIFFPNGSAGTGDQELLIYDLQDSSISKTITIIDPGFCSSQAEPSIELSLLEDDCDDNATPLDATDDSRLVTVSIAGFSVSDQCIIFSKTGAFSTDTIFYNQPYFIDLKNGSAGGGAEFVFVEDLVDSLISERLFIADRETCSPNAPTAISIRKLEAICDDNGTPSDNSDDKILLTQQFSLYNENETSTLFDMTSNLGDIVEVNPPNWTNYGAYDYTGLYGLPVGSAGTIPIEISIRDQIDTSLFVETIIANPGTCSDLSSVEKIFKKEGLKVFPNPFSNHFTLNFESEKSKISFIEIVDLLGRLILKKEVKLKKGENSISIDATDLPSGLLIVKMSSGDRFLRQVRVMKVGE